MAERFRGFDRGEDGLLTWGSRLVWREIGGREITVFRGPGPAIRAACLAGSFAVACEDRGLVRYARSGGHPEVMDPGVVADDIVPATLFGREGVVLIHKRAQVRFYEFAAGWPSRDLYSVYTPSWQGGLLAADVDGDGRPDLFCGNYWLRSPERFDLPWRLFAINTWTELEPSGMLRLAWDGRRLCAAQRLMRPGRVARFECPSDPTRLWPADRLPDAAEPVSVDAGAPGVLVAERQGRVTLWRDGRTAVIASGPPVVRAAFHGGRILVMGDEAIWTLALK